MESGAVWLEETQQIKFVWQSVQVLKALHNLCVNASNARKNIVQIYYKQIQEDLFLQPIQPPTYLSIHPSFDPPPTHPSFLLSIHSSITYPPTLPFTHSSSQTASQPQHHSQTRTDHVLCTRHGGRHRGFELNISWLGCQGTQTLLHIRK